MKIYTVDTYKKSSIALVKSGYQVNIFFLFLPKLMYNIIQK